MKFAAKVVLGRRHLLAQQPVIRVSWQFQIFKAAVIGVGVAGVLALLKPADPRHHSSTLAS